MANRREMVEIETDFLFLGSKITVDSDCSHEIRRWLLLGRKAMANLDSVLKGRDITLLTKVHIVKTMVFPVVTYSCESWNVKKAECQRIDAFKLLCWRKLLKVPWTAKRSNQSIFREISRKYSLEGLMLKLKFQYSHPSDVKMTHWKSPWSWERLRAEGEEGITEWDGWIASPMQGTWTWANSGRWWGTGSPGMLQSMGSQRVTRLGNWTTTASCKVLAIPNHKGDLEMHAVF